MVSKGIGFFRCGTSHSGPCFSAYLPGLWSLRGHAVGGSVGSRCTCLAHSVGALVFFWRSVRLVLGPLRPVCWDSSRSLASSWPSSRVSFWFSALRCAFGGSCLLSSEQPLSVCWSLVLSWLHHSAPSLFIEGLIGCKLSLSVCLVGCRLLSLLAAALLCRCCLW